jgi:hypothetical protein
MGVAMETQARCVAYVLVFECETCKRDAFAFFHTEKPAWDGTRRGTEAKRVLCQDADSPLPKP